MKEDLAINHIFNNIPNLVYHRDSDHNILSDKGQNLGVMSEVGWLKTLMDEQVEGAILADTCPIDYRAYQQYQNSDEVVRRSDV